MDKQAKKAARDKFKANELKAFRESLPMDEREFPPLFDYLDRELSAHPCQNDLRLFEAYCARHKIDPAPLAEWMRQHGGYCDCEVLANCEELFYYLDKPSLNPIPSKKAKAVQREKLDSLTTDFGFSIHQVPSPWVLLAITQGKKTVYQFQIGKKSDFATTLEANLPLEKLDDEQFLQTLWVKKQGRLNDIYDAEFLKELIFSINREQQSGFHLVQVETRKLVPVLVVAYRPGASWCLVMQTEWARRRGDVQELGKLLAAIEP